eukprot:TRINITY_DN30448_c0_g1_i1.p1 TRINITY_DN30448_c0_g1~~TRINITY_DN30448_c0_g1_i1.p1  ORF type:complete len:786 (+),score=110.25 TRINITY_DN30448_c0_g1_i1:180-2360(+)
MTHVLEGRRLRAERQKLLASLGSKDRLARKHWVQGIVRDTLLYPLTETAERLRNFHSQPRITRRWTDPLGFRVYLFTLQTRPRFHMPCSLFLPGTGEMIDDRISGGGGGGAHPRGAVLWASGHDAASFREPTNQEIILHLVLMGIAVLACDPLSQGERHQYNNASARDAPAECVPDADTLGSRPSCTEAHNAYGQQAALLNVSLASFFVWDALKALDLLEGITNGPLGMLGCSGGGDLTAYVGAIDERVEIAVIGSWFTSWFDVLDKQVCLYDAEQLWHGALPLGLDKADLVSVRAPKATMVLENLQDLCFPPSDSGREEVLLAFERAGAKDQLWWERDHGHHGWTPHQLRPLLRFFGEFYGLEPHFGENLGYRFSMTDLQITATGQLVTDPAYNGAVFMPELIAGVHDALATASARPSLETAEYGYWIADALPRLAAKVCPLDRQPASAEGFVGEVGTRRLGHIDPLQHPLEPLVLDGHATMEMWFLPTHGVSTVLVKAFASTSRGGNFVALLFGISNHWEDPLDSRAAAVVRVVLARGGLVFAVGLSGVGGHHRASMVEAASILLGRPLVAVHANEILMAARFVVSEMPNSSPFVTIGLGAAGPAALHAALAEPGYFGPFALVDSLASYASVATSPSALGLPWPTMLHGVLAHYDLSDLVAALCPRALLVLCPRGAGSVLLQPQDAWRVYVGASSIYGRSGLRSWFRVSNDLADLSSFLADLKL